MTFPGAQYVIPSAASAIPMISNMFGGEGEGGKARRFQREMLENALTYFDFTGGRGFHQDFAGLQSLASPFLSGIMQQAALQGQTAAGAAAAGFARQGLGGTGLGGAIGAGLRAGATVGAGRDRAELLRSLLQASLGITSQRFAALTGQIPPGMQTFSEGFTGPSTGERFLTAAGQGLGQYFGSRGQNQQN